jgi:hypothetical protein
VQAIKPPLKKRSGFLYVKSNFLTLKVIFLHVKRGKKLMINYSALSTKSEAFAIVAVAFEAL